MPRYAYQKPANRLYSYNMKYMNNYYKPLTQYIENKTEEKPEKGKRAPSEQPGHQSLAERLKTFPMDGTIYSRPRATSVPPSRRLMFEDEDLTPAAPSAGRRARSRPASTFDPIANYELRRLDPIWFRHPWDWDCYWIPPHENRVRPHFGVGTNIDLIRRYLILRPIGEENPRHIPIWMKHPYRLPVEDVVVPPHESSIWPESVPHFNLVSSYDAMVGYLGLKNPVFR